MYSERENKKRSFEKKILDFIEPLTSLGLTLNQAKIYLTVTQSEADTIKAISRISGIPPESIYRSVSVLEELDLIERTLAKPTRYRAMPLKEGINLLKARDKLERYGLYKKTDELVKNMLANSRISRTQDFDDELIFVRGHYSLELKIGEAVLNAKESFQGITFPEAFRNGMQLNTKNYERSIKRGIKFDHIVSQDNLPSGYKLGDEHLLSNDLWERKSVSATPIGFVLIDGCKLFLSLTYHKVGREYRGLYTNNPCLCAIAQNWYEGVWKSIQ